MADTDKVEEDIFCEYLNTILPLMVQYEALTSEYPVAITNEIRAIFTHLARCRCTSSPDAKLKNLTGAKRHVSRTVRDCFKYICIAYRDEYENFQRLYRYVDLHNVDNGDFLPKLATANAKAIKLLKQAKELEIKSAEDEAIYEAYQATFVQYGKMYKLIDMSDTTVGKKFAQVRNKHRWWRCGWVVLWLFAILGVIGSIPVIWDFCKMLWSL